MPRDLDGLADVVVLTVKTALGPVLERLAALDARLAIADRAEQSVSEIRDRIVAVETKAAMPRSPEINLDAALVPVCARLAATETSIATLSATEQTLLDLRDRIVAVETKAAIPRPPEINLDAALAPVLARLVVAETTMATLQTTERTLADIRDRVVASETKAALPVVPAIPDAGLTPVLERLASVETTLATIPATEQTLADMRDRVIACETKAASPVLPDQDVRDRLVILEMQTASATEATGDLKARVSVVEARVQDDSVTQALAAVSERVAIVETRAPVPGPQGKDGIDGKDGADGLGFDDLKTVQQDDRSFTIKAIRGDRVRDIGTAIFPVQIQRGVYIDGKSYERGDVVTWAGSQWYCDADTIMKPGDGSKAWTLVVKRGRDGKDGRDAPGAVPVVSVGRVS